MARHLGKIPAALLAAVFEFAAPHAGNADGGPENALVVVNADSWASTCIANEYVAARKIPPANVVRLRNIPDFERMGVEDFRKRILAPVLLTAEQRGIAGQIDYVLYSADFPWAIDVSADLNGKPLPKLLTQPASITGLTYLYPLTMSKNAGYLGLNTNFYYRKPPQTKPEPRWSDEDIKLYNEALTALRKAGGQQENPNGKADKAVPAPPKLSDTPPTPDKSLRPHLESLLKLRKSHPKSTELLYNLACMQARMGDADSAMITLREAVDNGWWDMRAAAMDPDFATVRGREDFAILAARAKLTDFDLIPSSGFRATVGWLPTGQPVPMDKGMRYMLSTVLACTSGRGNSVSEAVHSLHRSIGADGSRPKGTVYFMRNGDVRSTTREWGFRKATELLRARGVNAEIEEGVLPRNKADVAGVTIGSADFNWPTCGSTLLPGAIGDNLTSYGGALGENDGQTAMTEFIRHGAAGASGTVTEPFALQAKFPAPFIHHHYAQGCTLAESYYQALAGPYQLLIIGDALCNPWRRDFKVLPGDLAPGAVLKGKIQILPSAQSTEGVKPGLFEIFLDGRRIAFAPPGKPLEFNSADASDGPRELVVAAIAADGLDTRGRIRIPVVIRNGEMPPPQFSASAANIAWDAQLTLTATAPGAKSITICHDLDEIARIEGEGGKATIDARTLGQGPARLNAVATFPGGKRTLAEFITVRITPPVALAAPASAARKVYADGFIVKKAGGKKTVVQKADGNWLHDAGVATGENFAVEGWFKVPAQEVYQFQLRGAAAMRLSVDGTAQEWPRGTDWWFVPVHLAPGRHWVRIEGVATAAGLDIRFGGPGSRRLDGTRFQHPDEN